MPNDRGYGHWQIEGAKPAKYMSANEHTSRVFRLAFL